MTPLRFFQEYALNSHVLRLQNYMCIFKREYLNEIFCKTDQNIIIPKHNKLNYRVRMSQCYPSERID